MSEFLFPLPPDAREGSWMPRAPNPTGVNQYGDKEWPPDDILRPILMQFAVEQLSIDEKKARFLKKFGISIGKTRLCAFNRQYNIPSVRKPPPVDYCAQLVMEEADSDAHGRRGSNTIQADIRRHHNVLVPRQVVRDTLAMNQPDIATARMPGKKPPRKPLRALGPDYQHHSDGWEKCGALALQMGGVGIPVYAAKDQYSSKYVQAVIVPHDRLEDVIAHVYLDRVEALGGIPITEVTDLGSEHGVMAAIASTFRTEFAPELSGDVAPARLGMSSTKNTPIEGGWHCLREYTGYNLADAMKAGREDFNPTSMVQRCLFNWIWPPVVQAEVDEYVGFWNCHRIPHQAKKANPSGVTPNHAYEVPEAVQPRGQHCLIKIPRARVQEVRANLRFTRSQAMSFVSDSFALSAQNVYVTLGLPSITINNAWTMFRIMLPHLLILYPHDDPEPAFIFTL